MVLTVEERLNEAQAAYDAIVMGTAVAEARDSDGSTIRYSKADLSRLERLIAGLQSQIATGSTSFKPSGPMRVFG